MDYLGGNGNGSLWYAAQDAPITSNVVYQRYSQTMIANVDVNVLKDDIAGMLPSAQTSPVLNYLMWLLNICEKVA